MTLVIVGSSLEDFEAGMEFEDRSGVQLIKLTSDPQDRLPQPSRLGGQKLDHLDKPVAVVEV
jgi:hypothetical protein